VHDPDLLLAHDAPAARLPRLALADGDDRLVHARERGLRAGQRGADEQRMAHLEGPGVRRVHRRDARAARGEGGEDAGLRRVAVDEGHVGLACDRGELVCERAVAHLRVALRRDGLRANARLAQLVHADRVGGARDDDVPSTLRQPSGQRGDVGRHASHGGLEDLHDAGHGRSRS
jgi:hypothetical protein